MKTTSLRARRVAGTAPILVESVPTQNVVHLSVDAGRPVLLEPDTARQLADALHDHADALETLNQGETP